MTARQVNKYVFGDAVCPFCRESTPLVINGVFAAVPLDIRVLYPSASPLGLQHRTLRK